MTLFSKFKVSTDNHAEHLTLFPSLKPSSRFEAIALRVCGHYSIFLLLWLLFVFVFH